MDPLAYLFGLEQFGIKFGLENISTLVERLGHPERSFASVHIAGTNGKGSVTAMVDASLRAAGHRSARYTSPHLVDLAERFVIDGRPVAVVRIGDDVYAIGDTCSHAEVSLSEGEVYPDERAIECWKHGSTFSIVTGEPQTLPAEVVERDWLPRSVFRYEEFLHVGSYFLALRRPAFTDAGLVAVRAGSSPPWMGSDCQSKQ